MSQKDSLKASSKQGKELPSKSKRGQKAKEITPEGLQALLSIASSMYQTAKKRQPTALQMRKLMETLDLIKANKLQ